MFFVFDFVECGWELPYTPDLVIDFNEHNPPNYRFVYFREKDYEWRMLCSGMQVNFRSYNILMMLFMRNLPFFTWTSYQNYRRFLN
ncbi:MAG: hypothetical protein N2517_06055 [Ignavibacteria bacterium]|nr:hypothetical protein [Ignavibacteria bacterium]